MKRKASSDATTTASKLPLDIATTPCIIAEHPHSQVAGTESAATSSQVLSTQQPKSPPNCKYNMHACHMHNSYDYVVHDCMCYVNNISGQSPYKSGMKSFTVHTPQRKKCIKHITRRSRVSLVSSVINSPSNSKRNMSELACK